MSKRARQLTVGAVGFAIAWAGAFLRFLTLDTRTHDTIITVVTLGRIRTTVNATTWDPRRAVDSWESLATAIFCLGLVLIAAAIIGWMQTSTHEHPTA